MTVSPALNGNYFDDDGYPTEEAEKLVAEWPHEDNWRGLMAFIKPLWRYADCGYWTESLTDEGRKQYEISTAGWSGNESLIYALQENKIFWAFCWVQSRRGGHYIFEIRP